MKDFLHICRDEEAPYETKTTLDEFVDSLVAGDWLVCESGFESYNAIMHNHIIRKCRAKGIILKNVVPRSSGRLIKRELLGEKVRDLVGIEARKANFLAAMMIREWARNPAHLRPPRFWPEKPQTLWEQFESRRRAEVLKKKDPWVQEMLSYLPPFKEAPEAVMRSFGDKKDYALKVILPYIITALEAPSRRKFEHECGFSEAGRPCFLRSTLYRRSVVVAKRVLGVRKFTVKAKRKIKTKDGHTKTIEDTWPLNAKEAAVHKKVMNDMQDSLYWIYREVKRRKPAQAESGPQLVDAGAIGETQKPPVAA